MFHVQRNDHRNDIKSAVAIDRTVDHLIPLVQRSAARAALLRDKRLEIQMSEDGTVAARFVTAAK